MGRVARWTLAALLLCTLSLTCGAQQMPDAPSQVVDKKFVAMEALYLGALAADYHSTSSFIHRGTCEESNPLLGARPSDRKLIVYGVAEAAIITIGAYTLKRTFRRHDDRFARNLWAGFTGMFAAGHAVYAAGNYRSC